MAITSSGYSLQVGVKVDTSSLRSQLDNFGTKYVLNIKANVTGLDQTSKLSANIKDISNSTNSVTTSVGEATRATTTYTTRASSDYKKLQSTIEGAIQSQKSLGQVMIDQARTRAVTLAINEIIQAFQEAINIVKEFDDAVTEMKKVSDLSGESLEDYTKKLGELGAETARTRAEMVEASTSFLKSGYSEQESAELSKVSTMFQNIADDELSASESAEILIATMKGFDLSANEAERVADVINEV